MPKVDYRYKRVGQFIQTLRKTQNWTQQDVAMRLNITTAAVSKIESGITDLTLSRLEQFGKLYNLSIVELILNQHMVDNNYAEKIEHLYARLREKESEMLDLQRKLIHLYESLYALPKK